MFTSVVIASVVVIFVLFLIVFLMGCCLCKCKFKCCKYFTRCCRCWKKKGGTLSNVILFTTQLHDHQHFYIEYLQWYIELLWNPSPIKVCNIMIFIFLTTHLKVSIKASTFAGTKLSVLSRNYPER